MTKEEIKKEVQDMFEYHCDEFGLTREEAIEVVMINIVELYYNDVYSIKDTVEMLKELDCVVDTKALEEEKERRDHQKALRKARKNKHDSQKFKPVEKFYRDCIHDEVVVMKEGFDTNGMSDSEIVRALQIKEPLKIKKGLSGLYVTNNIDVFNDTCVAVQYGLEPNIVRLTLMYVGEEFKKSFYKENKPFEIESVSFSKTNETDPLEVNIVVTKNNGGREIIKRHFPMSVYCLLLPRFIHSFNNLRPWKELNEAIEEQVHDYLETLGGATI